VGPVHPVEKTGLLHEGRVVLKVNGEIRQDGDMNQMIWKVPEMISYLSEYFELAAGDVILSGTPSGVAAVQRGDRMELSVDGLGSLTVEVV
jgi:fumarylpyruvate hydrolase